jgi:elongator complex protein 3
MVSTIPSLTAAESTIVVCSDIVAHLLEAHEKGQTINLNALKTSIAKKHGSKVVPRLVDIISAVPQESRDLLLPVLRAKPVRTASGVSLLTISLALSISDVHTNVDFVCNV